MTEHKPRELGFESWVEKQIREADERGAFDNLPGRGKPLPGAGEQYDEMWWVREKLRRENASYLPPSLAIRKSVEDAYQRAMNAGDEQSVRRIITAINAEIRAALHRPNDGPPVTARPFDVEDVVRRWHAR